MSRAAGHPSWSILTTPNASTAVRFYSELFGWDLLDSGPDYNHHHAILLGGEAVGGLMPTPEGSRSQWGLFLATDDAEATLERARELGATDASGPHSMGEIGTMTSVVDPGGAPVSFWHAGDYDGAAHDDRPGFPVFHDLHSKDADAAGRFYSELFGLELRIVPELFEAGLRYWTLGAPGGPDLFGLMDVSAFYPAEQPSAWNTYFGVPDVDASFTWTLENGAGPMIEPSENRFGRYACVADPTGATLYLMAAG